MSVQPDRHQTDTAKQQYYYDADDAFRHTSAKCYNS